MVKNNLVCLDVMYAPFKTIFCPQGPFPAGSFYPIDHFLYCSFHLPGTEWHAFTSVEIEPLLVCFVEVFENPYILCVGNFYLSLLDGLSSHVPTNMGAVILE